MVMRIPPVTGREIAKTPADPSPFSYSGKYQDAIRDIAIKNAQKSIEDGTMGSPYLSSNESIILSTNNVFVNTVPAEAILTNERLMLIDTRHAELRPQDIPFHAIETVTIGENTASDPVLSLSLVTGPGLTLSMGIVFPQQPKMRRVAERDEWANRLKELSIVTMREGGSKSVEILPPWVPGPLPDEAGEKAVPAPETGAESGFRNPPLMPRKPREPAAPKNRMAITAVAVVIIVIALVAGAYLFAPSLLGTGRSPLTPITPEPVAVPTEIMTTVATPVVPATVTVPPTAGAPAVPEIIIPQNGVWVLVKYDGPYSGTAGAPERVRTINATGTNAYQLSARNEMILATIQKMDNTGGKMTVEIYSEGKQVRSGSVSAPKGLVSISADLRTT
jgi:hypothetical protein